jgi:hypothetical protein
MSTTDTLHDNELQYTVSFRQVRRIEREDAPPPGRFEMTSSARLARQSRYSKGSSSARRGMQHRGTAKARY